MTSAALPEGLARTEDADAGVVGADPGLAGEVLHRDAVDLHPPQGIGVLGLECLCEPRPAIDLALLRAPDMLNEPVVLSELLELEGYGRLLRDPLQPEPEARRSCRRDPA